MSDVNKYINHYIENATGFLHDYLNTILQLKAQVAVSNELLTEKDKQIAALVEQSNINQNMVTDLDNKTTLISRQTEELNGLRNKISHMETLLQQITEMKKIIREKDKHIEELNSKITKITEKSSSKNPVSSNKKIVASTVIANNNINAIKDDF